MLDLYKCELTQARRNYLQKAHAKSCVTSNATQSHLLAKLDNMCHYHIQRAIQVILSKDQNNNNLTIISSGKINRSNCQLLLSQVLRLIILSVAAATTE